MNVALALLAGAGFVAASLAGLRGVAIGHTLRALAIASAAGILLAISFADIFPEALESAGHERAVAGFLIGFVILFVIEAATKGHTHHDEGEEHVHSHRLWPFVIGLALHNFTDGFAIGTSDALSDETATGVSIGVLVHQLPVGISFAAVVLAGHVARPFAIKAALGLGLAIPLGAIVVLALPDLTPQTMGMMFAAAGGALAYIGAGHLLPEAHAERSTVVVSATFPLVLLLTAYLFLEVLAQH